MILNAQPKQLALTEDGRILWQPDASNPLPGQPVAVLRKGAARLSPALGLIDGDLPTGEDRDAVAAFLQAWLDQHIKTVLAPLTDLTREEGIDGPAKDIAVLLHDALGILPRQDLEPLIARLDPEARKTLRQRHVRLGPVLVFIPELNKPAAVRLRATLWWLWHDRALPAPLPRDGVVSVVVDESAADPVYQRAIGYPVYGGRAIRVDMLDRLISAIYDSADKGAFRATHAMAEWMGCSIPDLYKIIESMGHTKLHDPADQSAPTEPEQPAAETAAADPVPVPAEGAAPAAPPVAAKPDIKPDLATFRLKRGRANDSAPPPRAVRPAPKPEKAKSFKPRPKAKPERPEKRPTSFEARPQQTGQSPFAMLEQLKAGMKDK